MSLNKFIANGKLPRFEGNYKKGEGEKKSFLSWAISVKRDFKPADAQYYPEDLLNFKAFGAKADFINNFFNQGDGLIITGRVQKDDDYEKDGQTMRGQMFILVEDVSFAEGTSKGDGEGAANKPAGATKPAVGKPAVGKPPVGRPGGAGLPGKKKPFNN